MSQNSKIQVEPEIWKVQKYAKLSYFVQVSGRIKGKTNRPSRQGVVPNRVQARALTLKIMTQARSKAF